MSKKNWFCIFGAFTLLWLGLTGLLNAQIPSNDVTVDNKEAKLVSLIRDIIKSDFCKEQVVNIKGLRAMMKLSGEEDSPEGLRLIKQQQDFAVEDVLSALAEFGKLNDGNREEAVRLTIKLLDEECAQ